LYIVEFYFEVFVKEIIKANVINNCILLFIILLYEFPLYNNKQVITFLITRCKLYK